MKWIHFEAKKRRSNKKMGQSKNKFMENSFLKSSSNLKKQGATLNSQRNTFLKKIKKKNGEPNKIHRGTHDFKNLEAQIKKMGSQNKIHRGTHFKNAWDRLKKWGANLFAC